MHINATPEQVAQFLENDMDRYMAMLKEMVDINSFTANAAGIDAVAAVTARHFEQLGFSAESIPSEHPDYGNHLVLTREGRTVDGKAVPKIGLVSHLDTVFSAEEEKRNDFHWRVEGNRIYGPGTNDIKGGTVVIYMMLEALKTYAPDAFDAATWIILLNAAEERGSRDFHTLSVERLQDGGVAYLVFEAGTEIGVENEEAGFGILQSRKGMARYRVHVEGKASHAGTAHHQGANAITQIADVVQQIADFTDYDRNITFNVGTITGGVVTNRVPHSAEAQVEMRCYDKDVFEEGVAKMMALNGYSSVQSAASGYPCKVTIELVGQMNPWPINKGSQGLISHWQAAAEELEVRVVPFRRGGLSDGNHMWDKVPTIDALGPNGAFAHCSERSEDGSKDQEYVLRDSFVPKAVLNTYSLLELVKATAK